MTQQIIVHNSKIYFLMIIVKLMLLCGWGASLRMKTGRGRGKVSGMLVVKQACASSKRLRVTGHREYTNLTVYLGQKGKMHRSFKQGHALLKPRSHAETTGTSLHVFSFVVTCISTEKQRMRQIRTGNGNNIKAWLEKVYHHMLMNCIATMNSTA